jgi:hypothetical protein
METNKHTYVRLELERHLANAKEDIKSLATAHIKIRTGSWENNAGIVMAYLSYFTNDDPNEDNIDITIQVDLGSESGQFTADICWSSGEIINELAHNEFSYNSLQELLDHIRQLMDAVILEVVSYFRNLSQEK